MREKATARESRESVAQELSRSLPTPVRRFPGSNGADRDAVGSANGEMWLKDDGVTAESYGGNKVRKLAPLLADAMTRGSRRIVTFGAAGSHHVLATTWFARAVGMGTMALLAPQPHTQHAELILRCAVGAGLQVHPIASLSDLPRLGTRLSRGDYLIGPGGMGALGASGYFDAALELEGQVSAGKLPPPDWIVVAAGSGSTLAGLLAGLSQTTLRSSLVGVCVAPNPAIRPIVLSQALAVAKLRGVSFRPAEVNARLHFDRSRIGKGYGHPVEVSEFIQNTARDLGLRLDPTYSAKALAAAYELAARLGAGSRVLYWQTLSATFPPGLQDSAPALESLPIAVRRLLVDPKGITRARGSDTVIPIG